MLDPMRSRYIHAHPIGQGQACVLCLRNEIALRDHKIEQMIEELTQAKIRLDQFEQGDGASQSEWVVLRNRLNLCKAELATAKADLERARGETASAAFFVACMVCAKGGEFYIPFSIQESLNKDCILHRIEDRENRITRLILSNHAALAPEQKGE